MWGSENYIKVISPKIQTKKIAIFVNGRRTKHQFRKSFAVKKIPISLKDYGKNMNFVKVPLIKCDFYQRIAVENIVSNQYKQRKFTMNINKEIYNICLIT